MLLALRRHSARNNKRVNQRGQVLVIGLIMAISLVMIAITVANVGMMVSQKIRLQNTVDASAYSAAVIEARYMNLAAYINRAIIANYDMMAFNTALWATTDAYDHGLASLVGTLYIAAGIIQLFPPLYGVANAVDQIGAGLDQVHGFFHTFNHELNDLLDQDNGDPNSDINKYIEIYNTDALSTYQGLLFVAMQASRAEVVKKVAEKMDPKVKTTTVLGLASETMSGDELMTAVDWVIDDPDKREAPFDTFNSTFNKVMGEESNTDDHPVLLGALTEASLDRFTIGRNREGQQNLIRSFNFGEILPGWITDALVIFQVEKCIESCLGSFFTECDCDFESHAILGAQAQYGQEDDFDQARVPVIARQRMREVNFFGLDLSLGNMTGLLGIPAVWGHTSGEKFADIGNYANRADFEDFDWDRFWECQMNSGQCSLNEINSALSQKSGLVLGGVSALCGAFSGGAWVDDHWDGSFDYTAACGVRYFNYLANVCWGDAFSYFTDTCDQGFEDGVPRYDWKTDLNNVGFSTYIYDQTGAEQRPTGTKGGDNNNLLAGPSIAVYGVKDQQDVRTISGLGIGNTYPLSALARSQVYYQRNPNRPDEKPNLFNPYWVARLAPVDSEDTQAMLKEVIPFVGSYGIPIKPTN
ncbi:Tad domain-containing protein [bacterium]|nr:Tad domain-containing protein [bacterium]